MINEKDLILLLDAKEKRAQKQEEIIDKYRQSLISFTLNIPGKIKDNPTYRNIHMEGIRIIKKNLKDQEIEILAIEEIEKVTGREAYIVVEMEEHNLKRLTVKIEELHPLGRIFDIDVFSKTNKQITRRHIGENTRKCLLCSLDAKLCMRAKNHTYESLIQVINASWIKYKTNKI